MMITAAEEWMREGRAEGEAKGEIKGRVEGQIKTLRRLLELKFGKAASEYQRRLNAATEQQLEQFTAQILSAQTIDEVFADPR